MSAPYPHDPAYGQPQQPPVNPYAYGQQPAAPRPPRGGDKTLLYVLGGIGTLVLVVVIVAMFGMRGTGDACLDAPRRTAEERGAISDQKERECIAEKVKSGMSETSAKPICILGSMGDLFPETPESRKQECEAKKAAERAANPVGAFASDNGLALGAIGVLALAGGGFFLYRRQQNKPQGGYGYASPTAYTVAQLTLDHLTEPGAATDTDDNEPYYP